jgi:hypothetical protein
MILEFLNFLLRHNYPIILLGFGGAFFSIIQIIIMIKASQTVKWPSIEGIIEQSKITVSLETFPDSHLMAKTYSNAVLYSYFIDDKQYHSNTIFIGDKIYLSTTEFNEKLKSKYNIAKKILVYYDPKNPQKSVLEKGIHNINILLFFIGIALLCFAIIIY